MSRNRGPLEIDIVGLSVRTAGARTPTELWVVLCDGRSVVTALEDDRVGKQLVEDELGTVVAGADRAATITDFGADWRALKIPPLQMERMHRMERVSLAVMAEALVDAGYDPNGGPHPQARVIVASTGLGVDLLTDQRRRIRRFDLARPVHRAIRELVDEGAKDALELIDGLFELAAPPIDADSLMTSAAIAGGRIANLFDLQGGHFAVDAGRMSSAAALDAAVDVLRTTDAPFVLLCAHSPLISASRVVEAAATNSLCSDLPRPFSTTAGVVLGEGAVAMVLTRKAGGGGTKGRPIYGRLQSLAHVETHGSVDGAVEQSLKTALSQAGVEPQAVDLVESTACGAGAFEAEALEGLATVFNTNEETAEQGPALAVSGHQVGFLGPATGLLALAKGLLSLRHQRSVAPPGGIAVDNTPFSVASCQLGATATIVVSDVCGTQASHMVLQRAQKENAPRRRSAPQHMEPIAIVACGVVAPGANSVEAFWDNITSGTSTIGDLPLNRWDVDALLEEGSDVGPLLRTRLAGVVDDGGILPATVDRPEPSWTLAKKAATEAFGGLSRTLQETLKTATVDVVFGQLPYRWAEAEHERRLLFRGHLQLTREALFDLDHNPAIVDAVSSRALSLFEPTSVQRWNRAEALSSSASTAIEVAQCLGLSAGRRWSIDAACASSLLALDVAAKRLTTKEADAAVVGGVAFNLLPEYYISLSLLGALSPHGAPPFDVAADGFVPAEGAGVLILRRLEDAIVDDDPILAVIDGIGVSSDGAGRSVFAPSPTGEEAAVRRALAHAGRSVDEIDYVEAHGTGTKLGDATEVETYGRLFGGRDALNPIEVGTVKSQIGHQSSAAGASGLIKAALALNRQQLPPSSPDTALNRDWAKIPGATGLRLPTTVRDWTVRGGAGRLAGVSAFGLGGINAHVVLSDWAGTSDASRLPPPLGRLPPRGVRADRLSVELEPMTLPKERESIHGWRVLLLAPSASVATEAIEAELVKRGAQPHCVFTSGVSHEAISKKIEAEASVRAVIDVHALRPELTRGQEDFETFKIVESSIERTMLLLAELRGAYDALADHSVKWLCATQLGGDLGLLGASPFATLGGLALGLTKGLRQELGGFAKGVDFGLECSPELLASRLVDELETTEDRMEVGYVDRRVVPVFRQRRFPAAPVSRRKKGVVVFTGGGRGVTFECALALSMSGTPVVVTGRREIPTSDPVLEMDEREFQEWVGAERIAAKRRDPSLTPVQFQREIVDPQKSARELRQNLARAKSVGAPFAYRVCDVTDGSSLAAVVEEAVQAHGTLAAVVHGAMVEHSTSLLRKTEAIVSGTLRTKLAGGLHLLDAAEPHQPEAIVFFGSGAGRFGNKGQIDYCAANNAMAAMLQSEARRRFPSSRAICIDWTAWEKVGAAARDKEMARRVAETGVSSISPLEGAYWFLTELAVGESGERLICEEPVLDNWGGLGTQCATGHSSESDDRGVPVRAGHWPFIDRVIQRAEKEGRAERTLDPRRDRFLVQHTLHGAPIFPMAFGVELVAEAAQLLVAPAGEEVASVRNLEIHAPAKVHEGRPLILELHARENPSGVVTVESTSSLRLKEKVLDPNRLHHRAELTFRHVSDEAVDEKRPLPAITGKLHSRSFFHLAKDPIGLGPVFSRASWIIVGDDAVSGTIKTPSMRDMLASTTCPRFLFDPLVLDASWQIASNWDGYLNGWVCVPIRVEEVRRGRRRRWNEEATVFAKVMGVEGDEVTYDITVTGDDDGVLLETKAMVLKRIERAKPL